jgi:hypothetical protein
MANVNPNLLYTLKHPALPPLASGEDDYPAVAIRGGDAIQDEHITAASKQHMTRETLSKSNLATPQEVTASKKRETAVIVDSFGLAPAGQGWAQDIMREMRQNHQALLQEMNRMNRRLNGRLDVLCVQTSQNTNRAHGAREGIVPVPNDQGEMPDPALFPVSEAAIISMPLRRVDALLVFYGVRPPPRTGINTKKSLLCTKLGLSRLADAFTNV